MFEANNAQNFYLVGDQIISNKTLALVEATKRKVFPEWQYHHDVFGSIDWTVPINESLDDLYRDRCQQLRDKYDYLILCYSGGSDSWTILNTFLKYNIHIDEIFTSWPVNGTRDLYTPSRDTHGGNCLSEWDYVLKPDLEYLRIYHPEIKITVHDYSSELHNHVTESAFLLNRGHHLSIGFFHRHLSTLNIKRPVSESKTIGLIYGCDKPQICIQNGAIYSYFIDVLVATSPVLFENTNQFTEMFFWGRDFPKIAVKGAQLVSEFVKYKPELYELFNIHQKYDPAKKKIINEIIRSLVYPAWDATKFQADKPANGFMSERDDWIKLKYGQEKFFTNWMGYLHEYINIIDPKFFNYDFSNNLTSYVGFISPLYKVKNL
jgi:hypothetical protein